MKNLADWLSYLESLHPSEIELGLERIRRVAQTLKVLSFSCPVVSVAGTNGKGTTVAGFEALARHSGLKIGTYTSPHLLRYNERVRINGEPVSDQALIEAFEVVDEARGDTALTYFEFGTLAALMLFKQQQDLDLLVLEIGLGGRLDAVNIVDSDIAIVTSIALDHQDWLGSDRGSIGAEKAGIFRAGKFAICGDRQPPRSLKDKADSLQAIWLALGERFDAWPNEQGWCYRTPCCTVQLPPTDLVIDNLACVLQAWECLGFDVQQGSAAFADVRIAGRLQQLGWRGRELVLDVAHNPAAAQHLARRLPQILKGRPCVAVLAALGDKDVAGLIEPLKDLIEQWHVAGLHALPRAQSGTALAAKIAPLVESPRIYDNVASALDGCLESGEEAVILVLGSFFTVSAALQHIAKNT